MAKLSLGINLKKNALFLACAAQASYTEHPKQSTAYDKIDLGSPTLFAANANSSLGDKGFVAATNSDIVVALRGTDDIEDWLKNFKFDKVKAFNGRVHKGFLAGVRKLYGEIEKAIDDIDQPQLKNIFIAGHSRGAAIAILLAAQLFDEKQFKHPKKISVFGFGCPRVGDVDFYDNYKLRNNTQLFVNKADPVPLTPLTIQEYVHAADQHFMHEGKLKVIDLDSLLDRAFYMTKYPVPDAKDHRIAQGYVKTLEMLVG